MPQQTIAAAEALERLDAYDAVVDARSPGEYALDHLPGAVNWPSLDDAERVRVGTTYAQRSAFEARKEGAALVARNIARHVERETPGLGKDWRPLVYCWRGGERSGALAVVLSRIGFRVDVLEGGYRAFRRAVVERLDALAAGLDFVVVCGPTGSGKSLVLRALAERGEQVLDLEALACHRGSVLGLVPGTEQPAQKRFDTLVWHALARFDASRPVFVESESRKIGDLFVAEALVARMRESPCVRLDLDRDDRVALLLREYDHYARDGAAFASRLDALRALCGGETVARWQSAVERGDVAEVVADLLEQHYDPIYRQSMRRNYAGLADPARVVAWDGSDRSLAAAAAEVGAALAPRGDAKSA